MAVVCQRLVGWSERLLPGTRAGRASRSARRFKRSAANGSVVPESEAQQRPLQRALETGSVSSGLRTAPPPTLRTWVAQKADRTQRRQPARRRRPQFARRWRRSTTEVDMAGVSRWGENPRLPQRHTAGRVPALGAALRTNLMLNKSTAIGRFLNSDNSLQDRCTLG